MNLQENSKDNARLQHQSPENNNEDSDGIISKLFKRKRQVSYDTWLCKHKPQTNLVSPRNQPNYLLSNWQGGGPNKKQNIEICSNYAGWNCGSELQQKRIDNVYSMIQKLDSENK